MMRTRGRSGPINPVVLTPFGDEARSLSNSSTTIASGTSSGSSGVLVPLVIPDPFPVAKAFVCTGAATGFETWDIGVYRMTDQVTGRCDLLRSTGPNILRFPSSIQEAGLPGVRSAVSLLNTSSTTDGTTFVTAIVNLSAGKLYLFAISNTHGTAASAVSSIDGGPTFTSRSTTTFAAGLQRTSIWSAVPAANYTGTLTINFGATTQTACLWSLTEFSGVDTATNDGIVQQNVGTGTSVTPQVTLSAFASIYNATFAAHGNASISTGAPKAAFTELGDAQITVPNAALETEWLPANDTTPNCTITSAAWGSCAVEIKANTSVPAEPWRIAQAQITSGNDSTDATTYTTASVTLKAGRLYLLAFENSKASAADAISTVTGGSGGVPTFTSRATTTFNASTANRVSVWSAVPTADYTGTLIIGFGANTQTGACWSLLEMSGVDTTTNHGIVQSNTNTGNSANPTVSLSAFGSEGNATFSAIANVAGAATVGPGWIEVSDVTAATPAQFLQTQWRVDPARNAVNTISSGQWGGIALEIKCDTSAFIIPSSPPGATDIYMTITASGTNATGTFMRASTVLTSLRWSGMLAAIGHPIPSSIIAQVLGSSLNRVLGGFSLRSLLG